MQSFHKIRYSFDIAMTIATGRGRGHGPRSQNYYFVTMR
jgi:hypothetical protein